MSDIEPTVQIVGEHGPVLINLSDFNPEKHVLFGAEETEEKAEKKKKQR